MFPGASAIALTASAIYAVFFGLLARGEAVGVATSVQLHRRTIKETIGLGRGHGHDSDSVRDHGHDHDNLQPGLYTYSHADLRGLRHKRRLGSKVVHKTAYFGTVEIGTQKQPFEVVFDSGSGNLVIPSSDCVSDSCLIHSRYNQFESLNSRRVSCNASSAEFENEMTIHFGTGQITGKCVEDQICIGTVCYRGSLVAATSESHAPFSFYSFDGVLGLALPQLSRGSEFSAVERLNAGAGLRQTIFAVFLSSADSLLEASEVTFGSIKTNHMESELHWVPVSRDFGLWEVQIDDITIDDHPQDLCAGCFVVVDTGTSALAGPSPIIQALATRLNVEADCSNFHGLPRLGFLVDGQILNLEPKEYVDEAKDSCEVSLMPLDVPPPRGPLFIVGVPFLEKFYTVYDSVNGQIGFAVARHASNSSMPPSLIMSQLDASVRGSISSGGGARRQRDHVARGFLRK